MGARQKTGIEGVRLPTLSRRAVLAGTSVVAFGAANPAAASVTLAPAATAADVATRRCRSWVAVDRQIERLQNRWAKLEGWLIREHSWCDLSPSEKQALPWSKELRDIDGILDTLFEKREHLLATLPDSPSLSLEAVVARLAVVERLVCTEDHPEAHALIARSRLDLIAMSEGNPTNLFDA